jgi:hypothetical protein
MYSGRLSVPPFFFLHFVSHVGRDWGSGAMSVATRGVSLGDGPPNKHHGRLSSRGCDVRPSTLTPAWSPFFCTRFSQIQESRFLPSLSTFAAPVTWRRPSEVTIWCNGSSSTLSTDVIPFFVPWAGYLMWAGYGCYERFWCRVGPKPSLHLLSFLSEIPTVCERPVPHLTALENWLWRSYMRFASLCPCLFVLFIPRRHNTSQHDILQAHIATQLHSYVM